MNASNKTLLSKMPDPLAALNFVGLQILVVAVEKEHLRYYKVMNLGLLSAMMANKDASEMAFCARLATNSAAFHRIQVVELMHRTAQVSTSVM